MDPSAFHLRIAERFAKLSTEQRRAVFEKVQAAGMNALDQFPVLAREPSMADRCPASHAQARQWFLWRMALDGSAYHIAGALRFHGALDKLAMQASLTDVVQRHEALRTVFDADEAGHVHQRVLPEAAFTWIDLDLRGQAGAWLGLDGDAAGELPPQVQDAANRMASQPFDLQRGPLLRVGLVRYAADAHLLVVVMHHIVADDASMDIMVDEFVKLYRARGQGVPADLPPVPVQCADHSVWQRHWLESGEAVRQLAWWRGALGDHHPVLQLPADHARSAAV
ncbi:condensation domain-containing protein, partial [Aquabacterium parvum]|uniref:condensation domain-containing protein n=1 Tax=Aquabacterium parvum TaxID=70584 RepID=UPI001F18234B